MSKTRGDEIAVMRVHTTITRHPERMRGMRCEGFKVTSRNPSTDARDDQAMWMTKLRLRSVFALDPVECFLVRFEGAFELARFHGFQDFAKLWARFHSQRD